jgi:hypothetical protein
LLLVSPDFLPSDYCYDRSPDVRSSKLRVAKRFSDRDKDSFVHEEYIAKFFENSLGELSARNSDIDGQFRLIDANRYTAVAYRNGEMVARCTIFLGDRTGFLGGIAFSYDSTGSTNAYNETLSVESDDQALYLRSLGMGRLGRGGEPGKLSLEGGAELYRAAPANSQSRLGDSAARYRGTERDLQDRKQQLRTLRQEQMRPSASASRAAIEEIVRLQAFLEQLRSVDDFALSLTDELKDIAFEWATAINKLASLPSNELTASDRRKVEELERRIRDHLDRYGFRSFQPTEISLSRDNFRPLVIARAMTRARSSKRRSISRYRRATPFGSNGLIIFPCLR